MPADKLLNILKQETEERSAGTQINISIMKKNKKESITVNVENVKTRSGWNGIKPYTRIHTPKVVYTRKGRRNGKEALV